MKPYQEDYTKRGIPIYDPQEAVARKAADAPAKGWYVIEVVGESPMCDPTIGDDKAAETCTEVITADTLETLCTNYDPEINGGNGLLVNRDHLCRLQKAETKALGWIKALDHDGQHLAAYVQLTPEGLRLIREGYYWAWSTEYPYARYRRVGEGRYEPTYLLGAALTNMPDHAAQPGITHTARGACVHIIQPPTHNTTMQHTAQRALHSEGDPSKTGDPNAVAANTDNELDPVETNTDAPTKPDETTACNADDDPEEIATNTEADADGWAGIADEIAEILGLGDTATGDDIVAGVRALKADLDALRAASTDGAATHSRRAPRLLHTHGACRMDVKTTPQATLALHAKDGTKVSVRQQDVDLVTHCRQAVDAERARLGRPLTPGEFNRAWSNAAQSTAK